jgi:hypothetical protein
MMRMLRLKFTVRTQPILAICSAILPIGCQPFSDRFRRDNSFIPALVDGKWPYYHRRLLVLFGWQFH